MENPFKKLLQDEELPSIIKTRVIDDIALIQLSLEMAGLFAVELPSVIASLMDEKQDELNDDKQL